MIGPKSSVRYNNNIINNSTPFGFYYGGLEEASLATLWKYLLNEEDKGRPRGDFHTTRRRTRGPKTDLGNEKNGFPKKLSNHDKMT